MTCLNSNTINVLTTIEGAGIGDDVLATSRHNAAVTDGGRLVDVRIGGLVLEKSDPVRRIVFPHDDWFFTAAPPTPIEFEPDVVAGHAGHAGPDHDAEPGSTVSALLDARRSRIAVLEAEVSRLTALAANKQTVINEDRADAKRNRDLTAAEVADLRHAVALEVNRTNDANHRADVLAARVQHLEVEAARLEHTIEEAASEGVAYSELHEQLKAVATRFRLDRTVEPARIIDSLAERIRVLIVQREQFEAEVNRLAPVVDASGVRVNPIAHAAEVIRTTGGAVEIAGVRIERCNNKFAKFEPVDLSAYTEAIDRAARLAVAAAAKERGRRNRTQGRGAERNAAAGVNGIVPSHAVSDEGEATPR